MTAEPATNVVPFPQPDKVQILAERIGELEDELAALRKTIVSTERLNKSLRTQLDKIKEQQAEEDCDSEVVRTIITYHYGLFGRTKKKIPLAGVDGQIIRWLLNQTEYTPRELCLASVGFAANEFYRSKGLISIQNMATSKVNDKRIRDDEKVWRFIQAGKKLRELA